MAHVSKMQRTMPRLIIAIVAFVIVASCAHVSLAWAQDDNTFEETSASMAEALFVEESSAEEKAALEEDVVLSAAKEEPLAQTATSPTVCVSSMPKLSAASALTPASEAETEEPLAKDQPATVLTTSEILEYQAQVPVESRAVVKISIPKEYSTKAKIMGTSKVTIAQMVNLFNSTGKAYPSAALKKGGAPTIVQFCTILYKQANKEGVRAEVVFAQAMYETGWLQFGGDVKVSQFNFAGIGATGGGARGAKFKTVAQGLLAQVQHLKAYASKEKLKTTRVDPRFSYVKRKSATTVGALAGKWAVPGVGYGEGLSDIMYAAACASKSKAAVNAAKPAIATGIYTISPGHAKSKRIGVKGASTKNGANVASYAKTNKAAQQWKVTYNSATGLYTIKSLTSGKYLDVGGGKAKKGANLQQWKSTGNYDQRWVIYEVSGGFVIASALNTSYVLDVKGASKKSGANLQLWKNSGASNQKFTFSNLKNNPVFKLYLDAGHGIGSSNRGQYDSGALGNGYQEAKLTAELVNLVASYAKSLYGVNLVTSVDSNVPYYERQAAAKKLDCTALVSIHFNSYNGSATGSESYRHSRYAATGSSTLQSIMHKHLISGLGLTNRGEKTMELSVCNGSATGIPATLLEICFIDNKNDMKKYQKNKDKLAKELALGLYEASLSLA